MNIRSRILMLAALSAVLFACKARKHQLEVSVTNPLDFKRKEIASIQKQQLSALLRNTGQHSISIKEKVSGALLPIQWLDNDQDGQADEILFQAEVAGKSTSSYIVVADSTVSIPESKLTTYARFVPERTDDYTWENDRVAFRVYGPDAQQRIEQKRENGTLSSGVDLWLKRTSQPVINKWYKGYLSDGSFYHVDRGEGYDPYHVGASRGLGGSGIWTQDSLQVSKNYLSYKTIAVGPLRTVFELVYAPWSNYGVREIKRISLDLGSNFSKFQISLKSEQPVPNYAVGISLHKNEGVARLNVQQGYFAHEESIDGSLLAEGIVLDPATIKDAFQHKSPTPDQSNLLILITPADQITYYAGFAWEKSGHIQSGADWGKMLVKQAQVIANPLIIQVN